MRLRELVFRLVVVGMLVLVAIGPALAQVNTVDVNGTVLDPRNLPIQGAKVTIKNLATGATRSTNTGYDGTYKMVGVPPGRYEMTVEAKGLAPLVNPELVLTLGEAAEYNPHMALKRGEEIVTVTGEPEVIETHRSAVSQTIDSRQINNLPINGRSYFNFALLNSQANRDSAPTIGVAPTSGLNFGGQRARGNQVSVDGADAGDNSINGVRSTVSQEAVQEFQLIISNYMPEFGRATGAVVNIVTKGGGNEVHGDAFGFLRHSSIQARNPFSVKVVPDATGNLVEKALKQPFTRVQAGLTIGGPIKKDKTFYFFSYETTRRQETGFTNIGNNNFDFGPPKTYPFLAFVNPQLATIPMFLTPTQQMYVANLLGNGNAATAIRYTILAGSASNFALNGFDFGAIDASFGVMPCAGQTARGFPCFPLPVTRGPNAPFSPGRPMSFVPLVSLIGNYPIKEGTSLWSGRLDHIWNQRNSSFVRVSVSPSLVTGIQVNAQNQNFGQNAGTRTSLQQLRDVAVVGQHVTSFSDSVFNEARYQFARRGNHYGFSQLPGGSLPGVNIPGFAFFGREPFSTVDRIERRNQWADNLTWIHGRHSFKFGTDVNLIQIRSSKPQVFELDFGGRFDFGGISATAASAGQIPPCVGPNAGSDPTCTAAGDFLTPGLTAVQAYGLGIPSDFLQGIGKAAVPFDNKALGFFAQDSWKMTSRLTMNYGLRYDIEFTPTFTASSPINAAAEKALSLQEGIPVYSKAFQPRIGFAWDPTGSGKTIVRAGYGIFFDHPLLAIAFDSTTVDGARSSQLQILPNVPSSFSIADPVNGLSAFNAASIFQGILNTAGLPTSGAFGVNYIGSQQRFDPFNSQLFTNQNYLTAGVPLPLLPFTFPVTRNFVYGRAQQANLAVERQLSNDFKIGLSYTYTHGSHLNRPRNSNVPDPVLLAKNYRNALAAGLSPLIPSLVIEAAKPNSMTTCGITDFNSINPMVPAGILGVLSGCPASLNAQVPGGLDGQLVATTPIFNFFRPSGPNPSFAVIPGSGFNPAVFAGLQGLAGMVGYPTGPMGVPVPWSSVDSQESTGGSVYHGLTVTLSKRFSNSFQLYSTYTWSHAIDDSTDLQSLLEPQNNIHPERERANSTFDQRHRWVTNAVFTSPYKQSDEGFMRKFLSNFTVAPIFEVSSGRPYTIVTGSDANLDFSSIIDRPSVVRNGTPLPPGTPTSASPFIPGFTFVPAARCTQVIPPLTVGGVTNPISPPVGCDGSLGRNAFTRPGYFTIDLRIARRIPFGERWSMDIIAEGFNMLNRYNVADVNPLCDPLSGSCNTTGQATATLDPRQFQFALKLNF